MYNDTIPKKAWYVTMTDSALSGWGHAEGRTAKYIIGCDTYKQAEDMAEMARHRSEMKYINITSKKPYYNALQYQVSYRDYTQVNWR